MANFDGVSQVPLLPYTPHTFSNDWKEVLKRPGTYSLFDAKRWELVVPNLLKIPMPIRGDRRVCLGCVVDRMADIGSM